MKIRLDVDALEVESFATRECGAEERGTVRGHYDRSYPDRNCPYTWNNFGCQSVSGQAACLCLPSDNVGDATCLDCA